MIRRRQSINRIESNRIESNRICSLCKSCYCHIRELSCLRLYLDFKTASTIATSIVHSKLDYCNSLYDNLPQSQTKRFQKVQNLLARAVTRTPKCCHITSIFVYYGMIKCRPTNQRINMIRKTGGKCVKKRLANVCRR